MQGLIALYSIGRQASPRLKSSEMIVWPPQHPRIKSVRVLGRRCPGCNGVQRLAARVGSGFETVAVSTVQPVLHNANSVGLGCVTSPARRAGPEASNRLDYRGGARWHNPNGSPLIPSGLAGGSHGSSALHTRHWRLQTTCHVGKD